MTNWRMHPNASALGVIAIISVMITATASEAERGAIENGINHPGASEEDRHFHEDESAINETKRTGNGNARVIIYQKNDTATDVMGPRDFLYSTTRPDTTNATYTNINVSVPELLGDQSDVRAAARTLNDPHQSTEHWNSLVGSEQGIPGYNNSREKLRNTTAEDIQASITLRSLIESSTKEDVPRNQLESDSKIIENTGDIQVDHQGTPYGFDHEDNQRINVTKFERHKEDIDEAAISSIQETTTVVAEVRSIEQKNAEEIRAISFQVPQPAEPSDPEEQEKHQRRVKLEKNEEARKLSETKKDHSRPVNNLLHGGKSTKAFYEIKPSIKTEMEKGQDYLVPTTTQKVLPGRKFILPRIDSAYGKYGPFFEDGNQEMNITARIGSTVLLDCKIGMLGDKEVTWLQHSKESFRLLTVGRTPYSVDQRISLDFRYPSNWRLQILYASPRDSGLYKCQVATHPPLVKEINLIVTAPALIITDDSGRLVAKERHLKAGSALRLRCEARDVIESLEESVVWTRGDETLTQDVSENRTMEISAGKEILVIVSTLIVERASPKHAGNYSCVVPGKAKTTIAVHVLNGELPAAVHDGNGVSRAFLNLWLIHLTMSYVFSR